MPEPIAYPSDHAVGELRRLLSPEGLEGGVTTA